MTYRVETPMGVIRLDADDVAIAGLWFEDVQAPTPAPGSVAACAADQLLQYFNRGRTEFDLPLAPKGTEFQQRVWAALLQIPYGETRTYLDIAKVLGDPNATRAVGAANGKNPISIVIPCHRVIGSGGRLTGYAGGLDRKQQLLELEGTLLPSLFP